MKCPICNTDFQSVRKSQIYCGVTCANKAKSRNRNKAFMEAGTERRCNYCGKMFVPTSENNNCCSAECRIKRQRNVDKMNQRRRNITPEMKPHEPAPKKYKSPISDKEQGHLNVEVKKKISPRFDPGRKLSKEEIAKVTSEITPLEKIGHRSRPSFTFGAAFGGER